MSPEDLRSTVRTFILKEFLPGEDPDELTDSTELVAGGILTSLATLKLITHLEERYEVEFEPDELELHLNTVPAICSLVERKLEAKQAAAHGLRVER